MRSQYRLGATIGVGVVACVSAYVLQPASGQLAQEESAAKVPSPVSTSANGGGLGRGALGAAALVAQGQLEAHGTWRTTDGTRGGAWMLNGRPQLVAGGAWRAGILLKELPGSGEASAATAVGEQGTPRLPIPSIRAARIDMGGATPVEVEATLSGGTMAAQAVDAGAAAAQSGASSLIASAEGALKGVKVEGTFTMADGQPGAFEGWWHLWKPGTDEPTAAVAEP